MSSPVQTASDDLCNLVRWAHSHGTICSIIPVLRHRANGSCAMSLGSESGPQQGNVPVLVWGCDAGHAYYWPLSVHDNTRTGAANNGQERYTGGHQADKVAVKVSCDLSSQEQTMEWEELIFPGGDSSAADFNGDFEPQPSRKRSGTPGITASSGRVAGKRVKQESTSAEDLETAAHTACTGHVNKKIQMTQTLCSKPQRLGTPLEVLAEDAGCEVLVHSDTDLLAGGSCTVETTEATEKTAVGQSELEELRVLLSTERNRNQQMKEIISSLKQDKELLQQELTKKAELICDFLQDKLRPEKRWPHCSNQTEPGSSYMNSSDDAAGFDSPTQFDSFEEIELHPLEHHRNLKSKRNRDGENTRVRMKNVVGVIARYMAALQEFRRSVSMKVAFDRVGVDRNTISRTAAIAELSLAAPEVFHTLAPWDEKEETLARYALRCRQAMDDNIKAKIKAMKAKGELLPIVSK